MIDITFKTAKWVTDSDGTWLMLQVEEPNAAKHFCKVKKDKRYTAKIKEHYGNRSLDANAYLWVLCQKIAEKIISTRQQVYLEMIKRVGQFEIFPIRDDVVNTFIDRWNSFGLGFIAETKEGSKLDGYTRVIAYYGSSAYDKREMSVLINEAVFEAKEFGIETYTPEQLAALTERWGNAKENKGA